MKKPTNLPNSMKCADNCGATIKAPTHCGAPMHLEGNKLVCWMGASCGTAEVPQHHNRPMILAK